ncbi:hypothetical protein ACHAWF_014032 [Thalassiosira exigua]
MGGESFVAPSSSSSPPPFNPSSRPTSSHHRSILRAVSAHTGVTPPVELELPFSPSPALAPSDLTTSTSLASNHAVLAPLCARYAYSVCADQISPKPVTTSITLGGTLRIIRKLWTTLNTSRASARIRSSMGSAIAGGANSRKIEAWPSTAEANSDSARSMSDRAESTTATRRSVIPARAETTARVGIGPEGRVSSSSLPSSPSPSDATARPALSRTSKSPTVRYSSASAKLAPPNLCTSHGLGLSFGRVTDEGQSSEAGMDGGGGLEKETPSDDVVVAPGRVEVATEGGTTPSRGGATPRRIAGGAKAATDAAARSGAERRRRRIVSRGNPIERLFVDCGSVSVDCLWTRRSPPLLHVPKPKRVWSPLRIPGRSRSTGLGRNKLAPRDNEEHGDLLLRGRVAAVRRHCHHGTCVWGEFRVGSREFRPAAICDWRESSRQTCGPNDGFGDVSQYYPTWSPILSSFEMWREMSDDRPEERTSRTDRGIPEFGIFFWEGDAWRNLSGSQLAKSNQEPERGQSICHSSYLPRRAMMVLLADLANLDQPTLTQPV